MLTIDKEQFLLDLRITQAYCEQQLQNTEKNSVEVLRSFNPIVGNGENVFVYYQYDSLSDDCERQCITLVDWNALVDPFGDFFTQLFEEQRQRKQAITELTYDTNFAGEVLILDYQMNIPDGASAVESLGLVDNYDFPSIDTWFYRAKYENRWVLFSWIPEQFVELVQGAIDVHFLDVLRWFENWFPMDYKEIMQSK